MIELLKTIKDDIIYIITNNIVCYIPFWPLRKFWYQLRGMKIGKGSRILMKTVVVAPRKIVIGDRTYINENCFLDGRSGLVIGNDVTIAIYSKLISGGHDIHDNEFAYKGRPISIGNHCAVFASSCVLGGAEIDDGCVFAAMSVVKSGKYAAKGIYGGNPATYIKERESNLEYKQDTWHPVLR